VPLLADLEEFIGDHRPHGTTNRRRDRSRSERLPAHRGVPVWGGDRAVSDANGRRRRSVRRTEGYQELNRAMRAFLVPVAGAVLIVLVRHLVLGKP